MPLFQQLQQVAAQLARQAWATPDPTGGRLARASSGSLRKGSLEASVRSRPTQAEEGRSRLSALRCRAVDCLSTRPLTLTHGRISSSPAQAVLVDSSTTSCRPTRKAWNQELAGHGLVAFVVGRGPAVEMVPWAGGPQRGDRHLAGDLRHVAAASGGRGNSCESSSGSRSKRKLGGAKIVLVSPDGALGRLPLGALPGKEPGKYLLEERTIAIVPVPQLIPEIVQARRPQAASPGLLLLGNIDYDAQPGRPAAQPDSRRVPARPQAVEQLSAAARHARGSGGHRRALPQATSARSRSPCWNRPQATKAAFSPAASKNGYLHLATHGFFPPSNFRPGRPSSARTVSASRLAGTRRPACTPACFRAWPWPGPTRPGRRDTRLDADDGILTAEEIGSQNLDGVELVMLSACETGLGKTAGGEGLLGLQRAFQSAGRGPWWPALWKVPDEATRALMESFIRISGRRSCRRWSRCGRRSWPCCGATTPKPAACGHPTFRRHGPAHRRCRGETGRGPADELPPVYWAAFVLSGDWR